MELQKDGIFEDVNCEASMLDEVLAQEREHNSHSKTYLWVLIAPTIDSLKFKIINNMI